MAAYTHESGTLNVLVEAGNAKDARRLSMQLFAFLSALGYSVPQSEAEFVQFNAVIINDKGRFKDTVAGILNPKDFLDTP